MMEQCKEKLSIARLTRAIFSSVTRRGSTFDRKKGKFVYCHSKFGSYCYFGKGQRICRKDKKWYGTPIKEKNQGRICSHVFVNWQQKVDIPCSFGRNRGKESY